MPDRPVLTVLLLTYGVPSERKDYARIALRSTLANLQYDGPIAVHIADDGTPRNDGDRSWRWELAQIAVPFLQARGIVDVGGWITQSNARRGGYGASMNLATQEIHQRRGPEGFVLPLEDDWELVRPLDAGQVIDDMNAADIGCVRLGYLGHTDDLWAKVHLVNDRQYMTFNPESPEKHVFTGHPRLEAVWWERLVGPWPEGKDAGTTELIVSSRHESRTGVAWPLGLMGGGEVYAHVGSVQSYEPERSGAVGGRTE